MFEALCPAAAACVSAGQKGIGFKSVFRVTDFPLIFSNGYSFGFDRLGTGDLGYLLPTWVGGQPRPAEFDRALAASRLLHMTCPSAAAGEEGGWHVEGGGRGQGRRWKGGAKGRAALLSTAPH